MPAMDGTGPFRRGQMTGRGMGRCRGAGFGRGMQGRGLGRGFGNRFSGFLNDMPRTLSNSEEKEILTQDAKELELELADTKKRLKELESGDTK